MPESVIKEIKQLSKEKGGIFENLIYRNLSRRITSVLIHTKITPNMVTGFSILLGCIAAIFYFKADYTSLVIGAIFFNLSYTFDCVDGELARYKKLSSEFGAWWDGIGNKIVEYVIFLSLTLGLYFRTTDPMVLILGIFASNNIMMISNIRYLNRCYLNREPDHEFRLFKNKYLASIDTSVVLATITVLLDKVYYFLLIYAVLGAVIWIRQIYRPIIKYRPKS